MTLIRCFLLLLLLKQCNFTAALSIRLMVSSLPWSLTWATKAANKTVVLAVIIILLNPFALCWLWGLTVKFTVGSGKGLMLSKGSL